MENIQAKKVMRYIYIMANLNEAFQSMKSIGKQQDKILENPTSYILKCIHCKSTNVYSIANDCGRLQQCFNCKKTYHGQAGKKKQCSKCHKKYYDSNTNDANISKLCVTCSPKFNVIKDTIKRFNASQRAPY